VGFGTLVADDVVTPPDEEVEDDGVEVGMGVAAALLVAVKLDES
jgi:hypothetical protein